MNIGLLHYLLLPHVAFTHGDFAFWFSKRSGWHWHLNLRPNSKYWKRNCATLRSAARGNPAILRTKSGWEFSARFTCKIWQNHDDMLDRYEKGMFHKLFFQKMEGVKELSILYDPRHPSRVNGKKRDVNCRRRFAICSYLKPGYGPGFVGYVLVGCNCFRDASYYSKEPYQKSLVVSPKVSPQT